MLEFSESCTQKCCSNMMPEMYMVTHKTRQVGHTDSDLCRAEIVNVYWDSDSCAPGRTLYY